MHRPRPPSTRPATALSSRTTSGPSAAAAASDWVLSILPARGQGRQVGIVALNNESARVKVSHLAADSPTWVKTVHLARTKPPCFVLLPASALAPAPAPSPVAVGTELDSGTTAQPSGPNTGAADPQVAMLVKALQAALPDATFVPVMRKYWNEQDGYEYLTRLIVHSDDRLAILTACRKQYYSLSAAGALFHWLEQAQGLAFAPRTLRIEYEAPEGTCLIDADSAANLELVSNALNKASKQHLLGLLDHCYTPMGTRFLRANILSPLTDPGLLDARLDAVQELVDSEERFRAVRKALEPLKALDLDKIVSRLLAPKRSVFSTAPQRGGGGSSSTRLAFFSQLYASSSQDPSLRIAHHLSYLLSLRTFLNTVAALRASVEASSAGLLRQVERVLKDERIDEIREVVREGVNEEVWMSVGKAGKGKGAGDGAGGALVGKHQRLFAIKAERKRLLDVARETYRENMSDINDLCDTVRERHALETLKLVQRDDLKAAPFVLVLGKEEWDEKKRELGRAPIHVVVKKNKVEFQTLDLVKLNSRLAASEEEILLMSEGVLDEIFDQIKDLLACLYKCAEAIALLDMLASFAEVSSKNDYVRPEWTDTLAIKQGRHPLHEQFRLSDGSFVPNDTYADDSASFQIINGPNMSGKSTLLRQIALLQIMAQIGCFVPATYASFRPVSTILTRLSNDDNLEASLSTFASEMSTMSMILGALKAHAGEGSKALIIVDELGRGTSPEEGVGIAHAIAEEIIKAKAFCFFATHFKELSRTLPGRYPNVVALHLEAEIDPDQRDFSLTFRHHVRDGSTPLTHYGLQLAKVVKLPTSMFEHAELVSLTLASLAEDGRVRAGETKLLQRRRALLELRTTLRELARSTMTDVGKMRDILHELQLKTIRVLEETQDNDSSARREPPQAAESEEALNEAQAERSADPQSVRALQRPAGAWDTSSSAELPLVTMMETKDLVDELDEDSMPAGEAEELEDDLLFRDGSTRVESSPAADEDMLEYDDDA